MAAKVIKKSILLNVSVSKKKYRFETYIFFSGLVFRVESRSIFLITILMDLRNNQNEIKTRLRMFLGVDWKARKKLLFFHELRKNVLIINSRIPYAFIRSQSY